MMLKENKYNRKGLLVLCTMKVFTEIVWHRVHLFDFYFQFN